MANYIFDPDAYAAGTNLTDLGWTKRWWVSASAWVIAADEKISGSARVLYPRNVIKFIPTETSRRMALSWDAIDSDPGRANVDILYVALKLELNTNTTDVRTLIRGSGASGSEAGYNHGLVISNVSLAARYGEYVAGSAGDLITASSTNGGYRDTWVAARVRINGDQHYTKRWIPADPLAPEADEPAEWRQGPVTDSSISAAGWVGLFNFLADDSLILKFAAATNGDTATFSAPSSTPVAFPGTVSNQTGTEGTSFSLDLSTYFSGTETPFTYSVQSGTLPAGLSLNTSTGVISGTPTTAGVSSGIVIRATDATPDTADSNSFTITINAAGDTETPTLTGSVTFASITQTSYTATWPAGLDNVGVTGYEYQIGSTAGAWTDAGNNLSAAITGRTAGTTETVYVRAYDAAGLRSTPAISGSVPLLSASTDGTITVGSALYPIKYSSASVLNESGLRATVLDATTLAQVLNTSGVVCTNGVITITDAALVIGNTYHLAVKTANGWLGVSDGVTAS